MSTENDFCVRKVKLLELLKHVKIPLMKKMITDDEKDEAITYVKKQLYPYISLEKQNILYSYELQIARELNCTNEYPFSNILKYPGANAKLLKILAEIHEEKFYKSYGKVEDAVKALYFFMESCKYGSFSHTVCVMPKIFHLLEYEDKSGSIASAFSGVCNIKRNSWIPFLPFLIHNIHMNSVKEKKEKIDKKDISERTLLSNILLNILMDVAMSYPEHVFFALEYDTNNSKKKIIDKLCYIHPRLISKLEEIVKLIDDCKPTIQVFDYLHIYKQLLDKAYTCIFQNFKNNKHTHIESSSFEGILKNPLIVEMLGSQQFLNPAVLECFQYCTPEDIVEILKKCKKKISERCARHREEERERIHLKFLHLSDSFFESDESICLFGQSALIDYSFKVKIYKFLPEVEELDWNDDFVYKINFIGNDGKVYSYLMKNDFLCRNQTLETIKLMQLLENLNVLLSKTVTCSSQFLNYKFPKITLMGPRFIFVPYHDYVHYHDIFRNAYMSKDIYFSQLFNAYYTSSEENLMKLFDSAETNVSEDIQINYVKSLLTPFDYFSFKSQFLRHISMLTALIIFLNISAKEIVVQRNSGIVTSQHLEFRLNEAVIDFITPVVKKFIGQSGMKVISKNVMAFADFLKDNENLVCSLLHLIKKNYSTEESIKIDKFASDVIEKSKCITYAEIEENCCQAQKNIFCHM